MQSRGPWEATRSCPGCISLLSRRSEAAGSGGKPRRRGGLSGSQCPWGRGSQHSCPSEHLPSFLSAQPAPGDLSLTARMEVGPATKTFRPELRCLKDGGPGPDTPSGEGLGGWSNLLNGGDGPEVPSEDPSRALKGGGQPAVWRGAHLAVSGQGSQAATGICAGWALLLFPQRSGSLHCPPTCPGLPTPVCRLNSGARAPLVISLVAFLFPVASDRGHFSLTSASIHLSPLLPRGQCGPAEPSKTPSLSGTHSE